MWEVSINLKVDFHYKNICLLSKTLHDLFYLAKRYMWEVSINLKVDFHYTKICQILPSWGGELPDTKKAPK